jgi:hypothetical protein
MADKPGGDKYLKYEINIHIVKNRHEKVLCDRYKPAMMYEPPKALCVYNYGYY